LGGWASVEMKRIHFLFMLTMSVRYCNELKLLAIVLTWPAHFAASGIYGGTEVGLCSLPAPPKSHRRHANEVL